MPAKMLQRNIDEYGPTKTEKEVYVLLEKGLDNNFEVYFSRKLERKHLQSNRGTYKIKNTEADFVIMHPNYGFLCLEVKGGEKIVEENGELIHYMGEDENGNIVKKILKRSPWEQAREGMQMLLDEYKAANGKEYEGNFTYATIFPLWTKDNVRINNLPEERIIWKDQLNNIQEQIEGIFNLKYKSNFSYSREQHINLKNLVKQISVIEASKSNLIDIKSRQLEQVNRVQDNIIYFINAIKELCIRGGAGTGKTYIAGKLAGDEAYVGKRVLCLCKSPRIPDMIKKIAKARIDGKVYDKGDKERKPEKERKVNRYLENILALPFLEFENYMENNSAEKFDAVIVDEGQDFTQEEALFVVDCLKEGDTSRLVVFRDDSQLLDSDNKGEDFFIAGKDFFLRENIRNTAEIYKYAVDKTDLGGEVFTNCIDGPDPGHVLIKLPAEEHILQERIQRFFDNYLGDNGVSSQSVLILLDDVNFIFEKYPDGFAKYSFTEDIKKVGDTCILVSSVADYKGLESDVVLYIHKDDSSAELNYVAYTRAKYYLEEIIIKN